MKIILKILKKAQTITCAKLMIILMLIRNYFSSIFNLFSLRIVPLNCEDRQYNFVILQVRYSIQK